MKYNNVSDITHKGLDISIYELEESGRVIVDVKKPCGELLHGFDAHLARSEALAYGTGWIDGYLTKKRVFMYVYIESERGLWTVGFYNPEGKFCPESDHTSTEAAAARVSYLNGSKVVSYDPEEF